MANGFAAYTPQGAGSGGSSANASVGPTGTTAPTSATEVGFIDGGGVLRPFSGTSAASGPNVAVTSSTLPTGGATSALQTTGNTSLASILADMTNGTQVTQITGTVPLPTGSATAANQVTGNNSLATIATNIPPQGAAVTAASTPVNIASDQIVPVTQPAVIGSGSITTLNLNGITGPATTGSAVVLAINGQNTATIDILGTYVGTIACQGSADGINWHSVAYLVNMTTTNAGYGSSPGANQTGLYQCPVAGLSLFRMVSTAWTSGTATITLSASQGAGLPNFTLLSSGSNIVGAVSISANAFATDVTAAAITSSTTSATITVSGTQGPAYAVNIPVTAVSGTNPTLQVTIQESADNGTNWYSVYSFPIISSTGSYTSPLIVLSGNRIRYVQTVTGTTPSFTRGISRICSNEAITPYYRNVIDQTIAPTTTGSTTASLYVENLNTYTAIISQGTGGSSVVFALDGSDDSSLWQQLRTVAGVNDAATPVSMSYTGAAFRFIRVRVVTGVASSTINYVSLVGSMGNDDGTIKPTVGSLANRSGTTSATPSTSTLFMAANPSRKYLIVQNVGTNTIWINFNSAATLSQPSIELLPGGSLVQESSYVSTDSMNVICSVASQPYTAKEGS